MRGVFVCTSAIVLALTVVAPGNSAPGEQDGAAPAAERRGPCQTINLGGVKIFYKSRMRCEKAKHYARRLYKTGGRDEPRNFTCESGTSYETGANCRHDKVQERAFGWYPGDKRKSARTKVLCWNKSFPTVEGDLSRPRRPARAGVSDLDLLIAIRLQTASRRPAPSTDH